MTLIIILIIKIQTTYTLVLQPLHYYTIWHAIHLIIAQLNHLSPTNTLEKHKIKFNKSVPIAQRCTNKQAVKRQQHLLEQVSIKEKQKKL